MLLVFILVGSYPVLFMYWVMGIGEMTYDAKTIRQITADVSWSISAIL